VAKRLFDIVVSGLALLVLAIPFLLIMLVLRFTGERKVWYMQDRVGQHGKPFRVFKFVTMLSNSENMGTRDITLRNDPRVLPFGRFLRKTKLNEFPQLINVLMGQMSIVGWRPLLPEGFSYYPQHVQEKIVEVKPGLTGVGSIVFRDEETIVERSQKPPRRVYQEDIAPYKGELELWYIRNRSIWLDIKICLLTVWVLLAPNSRGYRRWLKGLPARPDWLN
jgi:lipopolysaccharide/colanic/teichoic acid biosynthesis glycosyltransferase